MLMFLKNRSTMMKKAVMKCKSPYLIFSFHNHEIHKAIDVSSLGELSARRWRSNFENIFIPRRIEMPASGISSILESYCTWYWDKTWPKTLPFTFSYKAIVHLIRNPILQHSNWEGRLWKHYYSISGLMLGYFLS